MKKKLIAVLILTVLFITLSSVHALEDQDQLMIRIEGEDYSVDRIEEAKELLFSERVEVAFLLNEVKFAEGIVGLSEDQSGVEFIWVPHMIKNHRSEYVRAYNRARRSIYALEF